MFAGDADDIVVGGLGNDYIDGGANDDVLWGHGGNDKLWGDGLTEADLGGTYHGSDYLDDDGGDDDVPWWKLIARRISWLHASTTKVV